MNNIWIIFPWILLQILNSFIHFDNDTVTSSVSAGFLYSAKTVLYNSKPKLALGIKSSKLWCEARALVLPMSLAGKMSASYSIHYFLSVI